MIRKFLTVSTILVFATKSFGQQFQKASERSAIIVGYQASFEAKDKTETWKPKTMHIIELVYSRIKDKGGRHPSSINYYGGSNFILVGKILL